jgi:NhaC family Na+:H+ antiporter
MFKQTSIAYLFAIAAFMVLGFIVSPAGDTGSAEVIRQGIASSFNLSPLLMIAPVVVIVAIALKVPALPGIFIGLIVGGIFAMIFQGASFSDLMTAGYSGFSIDTGHDGLNSLLSRGGISRKMYAIALIAIAMSYGGIMEKSRQLEVVVDKIIKLFVKGTTSLIAATVGTTAVSNTAMAEQYVGVILPAKMFATSYRNRGFHPKMLSGAVDGTGTLTSALVPWNTCAIFMASVLNVTAWQYGIFAFFNWSVPVIIIILAAIGKYTCKLKDDPKTVTTSYTETYKDHVIAEEV